MKKLQPIPSTKIQCGEGLGSKFLLGLITGQRAQVIIEMNAAILGVVIRTGLVRVCCKGEVWAIYEQRWNGTGGGAWE